MSIYRMSQLGQCNRVLSALALNYEPLPEPEFLKLAAREGSRHEDWIVEDLQSEGWQVTDRQKEVKLSFPAFELIGHIDGIASRLTGALGECNGDQRLLEIKSMSRFRFGSFASSGFARFQDYAVQITTYHHAISTLSPYGPLPIFYVVKDRDSGKRLDLELEKPPLDWEEIYDSIMRTEIYVRKRQLCPATRTDDFTCRTCPFRYLCEPEEEKTLPRLATDVLRAARLRRQALELETEAKELRSEADPILLASARAQGKFIADDLSVVYVPAGESVSYPVTELRKLVPANVLEQVKQVRERKEYIRVEDLRQ